MFPWTLPGCKVMQKGSMTFPSCLQYRTSKNPDSEPKPQKMLNSKPQPLNFQAPLVQGNVSAANDTCTGVFGDTTGLVRGTQSSMRAEGYANTGNFLTSWRGSRRGFYKGS